jgi:very-short-patch-repair endonuclease
LPKKRLTPIARNLRRRSTDAENRLWYYLRARRFEGSKFTRQFPVGPHVVDFACRDARIAIELDGGQHSPVKDAPRTQVIEAFGYRIVRFWNNDVLQNTEGVLEIIRKELALARNDPDWPARPRDKGWLGRSNVASKGPPPDAR